MTDAQIDWLSPKEALAATVLRIDVGAGINDCADPQVRCLLTIDGSARLCVCLHSVNGTTSPFRDARFWNGMLVLGWGDAFYFVTVDPLVATRHELSPYFGYIYSADDLGYAEDLLLVASGERVIRLNPDGTIAWTSDVVGIDGVTIERVSDQMVAGEGEWDPPGGWKPFRLRLEDGKPV